MFPAAIGTTERADAVQQATPAVLVDQHGVDQQVAIEIHNVWPAKRVPVRLCNTIQLLHAPAKTRTTS